MTPPNAPQHPARPILAVITGHLTPYRIAYHRRIAAEIPELQLSTLVTKYRTGPWVNPDVAEIGTVLFDREPPPGALTSMILDRGGRSRSQHLSHELGTAKRVWSWLQQHRPAALVCGGYDELPVLNALRWAGRRSVPAFLWTDSNVHGDMATGLRRLAKNVYVPRITARYSGILVCGTAGRKFFHRYGVPDEKLFIMPVEPDYAAIERMPDVEADQIAHTLGLEPVRKRLVCCCRLIPVKRVDLVIDAFRTLAAERPDWDLIIVGKGEARSDLEVRAGSLLADRRVRFLGFQNTAGLAAIYRRSHALVLASDYEPWALVVNEAATAGMAIIASDRVGAAYELVKSGTSGFVFPAGNVGALTDCLRGVTDPTRTDTMRAASHAQILRWRREADPIRGLRTALHARGILKSV